MSLRKQAPHRRAPASTGATGEETGAETGAESTGSTGSTGPATGPTGAEVLNDYTGAGGVTAMSMASGPTASATGVSLDVALRDAKAALKESEDAVMAKEGIEEIGGATQEEVDAAVEEVGKAQAVVDEILAKLGKNKKPVVAKAQEAVQEATGSVAESDDDDAANYVNKVAAAKRKRKQP